MRWQDSRDPWELLKGRLYICIYIIARGSQRGYIIYTHTYRHTDGASAETEARASSSARDWEYIS